MLRGEGFLRLFLAALRQRSDLRLAVNLAVRTRRTQVGDRTPVWTNIIVNTILELGQARGLVTFPGYPKGLLYSPRSNRNRVYEGGRGWGEYLVDACWTTYEDSKRMPWHTRSGLGLLLAAEVEWGNPSAVREDFAKLVDIRADLRVMVGYAASKSVRKQLLADLQNMAERARHRLDGDQYAVVIFGADTWTHVLDQGTYLKSAFCA